MTKRSCYLLFLLILNYSTFAQIQFYDFIDSTLTINLKSTHCLMIKGKITDIQTQLPLQAEIKVFDAQTQILMGSYLAKNEGLFNLILPLGKKYSIFIQKERYLFHSIFLNLTDSNNYCEQVHFVALNQLMNNPTTTLSNTFFDSEKTVLESESKVEMDVLIKLLKHNNKLVAEISGYTNECDSKKLNIELSKKRANAVANYLISKGLKRTRFITSGQCSSKSENPSKKNQHIEIKITNT